MTRIFDKYLKLGSSKKDNSEKEKVLAALIGEDNVRSELTKQKNKAKLYLESIKKLGLINNQ